jgi:hypothetical protein
MSSAAGNLDLARARVLAGCIVRCAATKEMRGPGQHVEIEPADVELLRRESAVQFVAEEPTS